MDSHSEYETPDHLNSLADELHIAAELVQLELESAHALLCTVDAELANGSDCTPAQLAQSQSTWHSDAVVAVRTLLVRLKVACGYQAIPGDAALQSPPTEFAPSPNVTDSAASRHSRTPNSPEPQLSESVQYRASINLESSALLSPGVSSDSVIRRALVASQAQIRALERQLEAANAATAAAEQLLIQSVHKPGSPVVTRGARLNGASLLAETSNSHTSTNQSGQHATATATSQNSAPSLPASPAGNNAHKHRTPGVRWASGVSLGSQHSHYHSLAPTPGTRPTPSDKRAADSAGTYASHGYVQGATTVTPVASQSGRARGSTGLSSGRQSSLRRRRPEYWSAESSVLQSPQQQSTASATRSYLVHSGRKAARGIVGRRLAAATPTVKEVADESSPSDTRPRAGASRGSTRMQQPVTPGTARTLAQRLAGTKHS